MAKNSEDEKIKAVIQRAIDITKELEEPYRLKAFEIVLSKLWGSVAIESRREEQKPTASRTVATTLEAKIEELASKCSISAQQLRNVYDFQEGKPRFTVPLRGNHAENQVLASRYLLTAYSEVYGKDWIGLKEPLAEHSVGSLANLAKNLEKHPEIFRLRGQKKDREYKIVDSAKIETFRMIHELAAGGSQSIS